MAENIVLFDESPHLPEHIIYEIFARLPIKVLFKFRCVSKFCRSLTSDRLFIAASHRHRSSAPTYIISYTSYRHMTFYYQNPNNLTEYFEFQYNMYAKSINGLMCLLRYHHIMIQNLVTNNQFVLPRHEFYSSSKQNVLFCYCPKKDKYKVLVSPWTMTEWHLIFTLGVDNAWRRLYHPGFYQIGKSNSICIDGVLYCPNFSTTREGQNRILASFNVESEDFGVITYPDKLSPSRYKLCHLINVKGALAIIDILPNTWKGSYVIKMWIRDKGLNSECWVGKTILLPSKWMDKTYNKFISFSTNRNGEIVLASTGNSISSCLILVYNMEKKEWTSVEVLLGLRRDHDFIRGDFLVEDYVEPCLSRVSSYLF